VRIQVHNAYLNVCGFTLFSLAVYIATTNGSWVVFIQKEVVLIPVTSCRR